MRHLFAHWEEFVRAWAGKHLMLFFDYDGTLTPIQPTPDAAVLSTKTRQRLERLSRSPRCCVVVISGRALADLKEKVGIEKAIYVGNHGLEIEGEHVRFEGPIPVAFLNILAEIKQKLQQRLALMTGVLIEDKGLTLSVHYRLAHALEQPAIKSIVAEVAGPYQQQGNVRINTGKKVLELKPQVSWDKGKAALWLLHEQELRREGQGVFPVYLGDDLTDEDAFKALYGKGLTIFVGEPSASQAGYCLKNPAEVEELLNRLLTLLSHEKL